MAPADPPTGPSLTPRQLDVLRAVVEHGGHKGAAHALGLSAWTINSYLQDIRRRMGVETTEQAVYLLAVSGELVATPMK